SRGRAMKREESWDCQITSVVPADPLQLLETQRSMQQLEAAIEALTPRYKTIYLLCEVKGLPSTTVAQMTGLHPDTLRVRRHRARQQVAKCLRNGSGFPGPDSIDDARAA
ncbi:MAG TPA: sigma-70 family RNA polymerase sigma factor, partial [Polyangia bacterium]|nr:sigma-70 family RNA polymerase sigma factor [Polyangia bacterium]